MLANKKDFILFMVVCIWVQQSFGCFGILLHQPVLFQPLAYRFVIQFDASLCNGNGEYKDGYGNEQVHSCRCVGVIPCPGYLHVYQREVCDVQRIG